MGLLLHIFYMNVPVCFVIDAVSEDMFVSSMFGYYNFVALVATHLIRSHEVKYLMT